MTREEWEKKRAEMLKNRHRSKFTATAGDFTIIKPDPPENKAKEKEKEQRKN